MVEHIFRSENDTRSLTRGIEDMCALLPEDWYGTLHEEIVRCRDCKHHELQGVSYSDKPLSVCTAEWCEGSEHDNPLVEPDGFCAWGERKEA